MELFCEIVSQEVAADVAMVVKTLMVFKNIHIRGIDDAVASLRM